MVDFANLVLSIDATGMKEGDVALDRLAAKGAKAEVAVSISMAKVEAAFDKAAGAMSKAAELMVRGLDRVAPGVEKQARTFDDLRRSIDPAYAASQRYAELQRELAGMVDRGAATQRQANDVLEQAASRYLGIATASERAEQAQREQAQMVAALTGDYQALRASVDPMYAASMRYERAVETLNAAHQAGIVTDSQRARTMQLLNAQMIRTAPAAQQAAKGANMMGPAFVNAGFQVQDFAVQVAGGQSAMIAFAQQFPQLMGVLGFSGKLAIAGAAIGTLAAVIMAVAPIFIASGKAAKASEDAIDKLADAMGRYTQATDRSKLSTADMIAEWGAMSTTGTALAGSLAEMTRVDAMRALSAATSTVASEMLRVTEVGSAATTAMGDFAQAGALATETYYSLAGGFGLGIEQATQLRDALVEVKDAATPGDIAREVTEFNATLLAIFGTVEKIPPELKSVSQRLSEAGLKAAILADVTTEAERRRAASAERMLDDYARQAAMSDAIARYGKDSAVVEALKRQEAMRTAEAFIQQHNITGPLADKILAAAGYAYTTALNADQAAIALSRAEAAARALAGAMAAAAGFSANLDNQIAVVEAQINAARNKQDVALAGQVTSLKQQAEALRAAQIATANGSWEAVEAADAEYAAQMRKIGVLTQGQATLKSTVEANNAAARASKAGASASERLAKQLDKEVDKWRAGLSPLEKYRSEMEKLNRVKHLLTKDEFSRAVAQLNDELAQSYPLVDDLSNAFGDFVAGGLKDFSGFVKSILGSFQSMIARMVAEAARNKILFSMGFGGTGGVAATAAAAGGGGTGGAVSQAGGAMGLLGSIGAFGSGLLGGAMNSLGALVSGGIGNMMTSISAQIGATMAGATATSVGAALGAVAGPLAAVALVFSFFGKKTKELDRGLRVTVDGLSSFVEEFRTIETKRFWGLSKKVRTHYETADDEVQDAIGRAVAHLQTGILNAAAVLDFGASTFSGFAHTLEVSTKDLSEEEALKAVQDAVMELGDAFAGMVPGLKDQIAYGEGATQALERLANSLTATRAVADLLGHSFTAAGMAGGILADHLATAFGGVDAMTSAVQSYWQTMYSEQERLDTVTRQATTALAALGLQMPKSRAEYRAMVDALDLNAAGAHETYAALVSLAGVFDQILPGVHGLTAALAELQGNAQTGLEGAIGALQEAAKANASAAADWYKASTSIRDWIEKLRTTASPLTNPAQARANAEASYQATLARALAGDLAAANEATGAADRLLAAVRNTARTQTEAAVAEARILSDMGLLAGVGDIEGARHDVIRGLLEQQVDAMTEVRDAIAGGAALTEAQISALLGQLGALDEAIAAAEMINYAYLKERLQVTVDVLADADVPEYLRALLGNAATGVTGYVDFLVRSDLTPDLKWLAMTGASEHIKTIELIAEQGKMPADLLELALSSADTMVKSIRFVAGALPDDVRDLVFNDIDALQKVVNFRVGQQLPGAVQALALSEASEFRRIINVVAGQIAPAQIQQLALADPTAFRRALDIVAGVMPSGEVKALALGVATKFQRVLDFRLGQTPQADIWRAALDSVSTLQKTVHMMLGRRLDPSIEALALMQLSTGTKTISLVNGRTVSADTMRLALAGDSAAVKTVHLAAGRALDADTLRLALAGNSELARTVTATLAANISADAKRLALGNVGAYAVAVQVAFAPNISADARRVVLTQQGTYAAAITAAIGQQMTPEARRILLTQQGGYIANITAVLASSIDNPTRALLLNANTAAVRAVTISAAFAATLTADERAALSTQASATSKTIRAIIDTAGLSATGALYLAQLGIGSATVQKTVAGQIALSALSSDQRLLLASITETVQKSVAFKATGSATEDQLRLLGAVSATILRAVDFKATGALTADQRSILGTVGGSVQRLLAMSVTGVLTADQKVILAAGAASISRTLGLTTSGTLTDDQRRVLLSTSGTVARSLSLDTKGSLTVDQRAVLGASAAAIARSLALQTTGLLTSDQRTVLETTGGRIDRALALAVSGSLTADQRAMLDAKAATVIKTIAGGVDMTRVINTGRDYFNLLKAGATSITKTVAGAVDLTTVNKDQRSFLEQQTTTITRTIKGAVDLTGLSAQQRALVEGITGASEGKITLGGSFQFDPTTGFKTWFESSTKAAITTPMGNLTAWMAELRTALNALRDGIAAEGTRQAAAQAVAAKIAAAQNALSAEAAKKASAVDALSAAVGAVRDFDAATGGNLSYQGGAAQLGVGADGRLQYKADGVAEASAADLAKWQASFWGAAGLEAKMLAANGGVVRADEALEAARKAVRDLGGVPAFATGGTHLGGLRIVGEQGPELEATGPSRIYSASQTSQMLGAGNAELLAELRALRQELADLRALSAKGNEHSRDMSKILKRIDALGIKLDEDQNAVKVEA